MGEFTSAFDKAAHKWHHVSPSTVEAFKRCERIPYYKKILGLPDRPFAAQLLGVKMHGQAEHYLKTGQDCLDPRLAPVKKYLPPPNDPRLLVEYGLDGKPKTDERDPNHKPYDYANAILKTDGVPWEGYADLIDGRDREHPLISDYKTTSSIAKWAKTEKQLRQDVQGISYAEAVRRMFPEAREVGFRHLYAQTKGPIDSKEVAVTLSLDEIGNGWQAVETLTRGVLNLANAKSDADVPDSGKQHGQCEAYAGCAFKSTCFKSPAAMLRHRVNMIAARNEINSPESKQLTALPRGTDSMSSLIARLRSAPSQTPAPQAPAVAAPPAASPNGPEQSPPGVVAAAGGAVSSIPNGAVNDGPGWTEVLCGCCGLSVGKRPPGHTVTAHDGCTNPGGRYELTGNGTRVLLGPTGNVLGVVTAQPAPIKIPAVCAFKDGDQVCTLPANHPGSIHELRGPMEPAAFVTLKSETPAPPAIPAPQSVAAAVQSILPPDAPAPSQTYVEAPKAAKRGRPPKAQASQPPTPATLPAVPTAPAQAAGVPSTATAQVPSGALTPPVPHQSTATAAGVGTPAAGTVSPAPTPPIVGPPDPGPTHSPGIRLFVNCTPASEPFTYLNAYAADKANEIAKAGSVEDYRLIEFAKGRGYLAALIKAEPPPPGTYVAITAEGGPVDVAAEVLIPMASYLVRGVR